MKRRLAWAWLRLMAKIYTSGPFTKRRSLILDKMVLKAEGEKINHA